MAVDPRSLIRRRGAQVVELQLSGAIGESLGVAQDDNTPDRHAIEARVHAEDLAQRFPPQAGVTTRLGVVARLGAG